MKELEQRLSYYGIDERTCGLIRRLAREVGPTLGALAEEHWRVASQVPNVAELMRAHGSAVAALTFSNTERLFAARFDLAWAAEAERQAEAERAFGLDGRHRIATSMFLMTSLLGHIGRTHRWSARRAAEMTEAVVRVFMFDSATACVLHAASQKAEALARGEELDQALREFGSGVAGLRDEAASLGGSLTDASRRVATVVQAATSELQRAAHAAGHARHNAENTAGATSELAASISEIDGHAGRSVALASAAEADAGHTESSSAALVAALESIGSVVTVISQIAAQTNLLALNATIEAARAGEAGRSFTVVAHEVKALAGKTAHATEEIERQIAEIRAVAERAVAGGRKVGDTVGEIAASSKMISGAVHSQARATAEIAEVATSSAAHISTVAEALQAINAAIGEGHAVVGEVVDLSRSLAARTGDLDAAMSNLLSKAHAA